MTKAMAGDEVADWQIEEDCLGVDRGLLIRRHRDQLWQYRARQRECQAWGHRRDVREESRL